MTMCLAELSEDIVLWMFPIYLGIAAVLFVAVLVIARGIPRAGERDLLLAPLFWGPILLHMF